MVGNGRERWNGDDDEPGNGREGGVKGGECMDVEEGWTPRKSPSGIAFVVGR